jgi:hypothetical protein
MAEMSVSSWVRWLSDPVSPNVCPAVPKPKLWPWLTIAGWLAVQAWARYVWRWGWDDAWLGVHLAIGYGWALAVLAIAHGKAFLGAWSRQTWTVLALGAACLCAWWYTGRVDAWKRWFAPWVDPRHPLAPVLPFAYFAAMGVFWRLAVPLWLLGRRFGLRARDLGITLRSPAGGDGLGWLYLALFLGVLPFVVHASQTPAFLQRYPLARDVLHADGSVIAWQFALYQACYVWVFISGESFWRGVLTFGTERDLGTYGVLLMLVPYVIAHFGKPLPETWGAIAAGTVLGWLALKHRSVALGVAVHYGVAVAMDLLAVWWLGVRFV